MATNRRRIMRGTSTISVHSLTMRQRLAFLVGTHPDAPGAPWRSWEALFEDWAAVEAEFIEQHPTNASGDPPWVVGAFARWQADPTAREFVESYRARRKRESAELAAFAYQAIDASIRAGTWLGEIPSGHGGTPRGVAVPNVTPAEPEAADPLEELLHDHD